MNLEIKKKFDKVGKEYGELLYYEDLRHRLRNVEIDEFFRRKYKEVEDSCDHRWKLLHVDENVVDCEGKCRKELYKCIECEATRLERIKKIEKSI